MDKNLIKILPYALKYKSRIVWNIVFNVLYALFSTISFLALLPMLEVLFKSNQIVEKEPVYTGIWNSTGYLKEYMYYQISHLNKVEGPEYSLMLVISIIVSAFLLKNLFNYLASYHLLFLRNGVLKDLRLKMYDKIVALPISYYSEKRKGDVMTRILSDVAEVQNSFFAVLELIVKEPLTIIFSIIAMLNISTKLTLFVFIFIPISGFIISKIGKNLKSKSTRAQSETGYLISIVEESLSGLKVIKSYNSEGYFTNLFGNSINKLFKLNNSIGNKNNLSSPLSEFLGIVAIAVLLWYGGNLVLIDKTLNGSLFIVYMTLAYNILTPAKNISKASYAVKNGLAAAERVFEVIEIENTIVNKPDAVVKTTFEDKITLENINFRYEEENVLKNFSLEVPKGKTVALVGTIRKRQKYYCELYLPVFTTCRKAM